MGNTTEISWAHKNYRHLQTRDKNPNWRGGRLVATNGYVLVRVGVEHPLADVRGYAYEHRVVAEAALGRSLRPGEQVHHINGIKTDNRPENLEVARDIRHHRVCHRKRALDRRMPGESKPEIYCACGCGISFPKFDKFGRPRAYLSGHNNSHPKSNRVRRLRRNQDAIKQFPEVRNG